MNDFQMRVAELNDGTRTYRQIADALGRSKSHVEDTVRQLGMPKPPHDKTNLKRRTPEAMQIIEQIKHLSDGRRTSKQIAQIAGVSAKYVQKIALEFGFARLNMGARLGANNPQFVSGRRIDQDGYALVTAPLNHLTARKHPSRNFGVILEHRLVIERKLGRYLQPDEVVDHVDGLHLHNHPDNLRVFANNAHHLQATISGQVPAWSEDGLTNLQLSRSQQIIQTPVDSYRQERERGDVRLRHILLAWLQLEPNSPYLLGTHRWLEKAGIVDLSRPNLEHHLVELCPRLAKRLLP